MKQTNKQTNKQKKHNKKTTKKTNKQTNKQTKTNKQSKTNKQTNNPTKYYLYPTFTYLSLFYIIYFSRPGSISRFTFTITSPTAVIGSI